MADPIRNSDGTVQAAPPTMSAFSALSGQQPSAAQAPPAVSAQSGTPGFGGAILDLIKSLASSFAPRAIVHRGQNVEDAINRDSGAPPAGKGLGDQF